jgi:hypothetical protein
MTSFVNNLEPLLATLARLYAIEGRAREVAILSEAQASTEVVNWTGWNDSIAQFQLYLTIPVHLYFQLGDEREVIEKSMLEKAQMVLRASLDEVLLEVLITPLANEIEAENWRDKAKAWLRGENVSNQGRVRSDNVAPKEVDGLLFRSQPEINLYMALKSLGVSFAPLPVFIKGGKTYQRIEPDFVIIKDGIVMVVEVDGDTVHHETPAEAHARTMMLAHEDVRIERVKASECSTPEAANTCARKILQIIEKLKTAR